MKDLEDQIADILAAADRETHRIRQNAKIKAQRAREIAAANAKAAGEREALRGRLESDHCMTTHPKRDLLWSKAWEHGHSSGLADVEFWYSDLVELVK